MTSSSTADLYECANCGETADLLRCSRCHSASFCSRACHKAYWPFHRVSCHRNEFADCVEDVEPKFATWMRSHGKLAVLKDNEVDRLERAGAATMGASRGEVLQSMYNRLEPKPQAPSYTAEEMAAMRMSNEQAAVQAFSAPHHQQVWQQLQPVPGLGRDCGTYKWSQNQTQAFVFVQLPQQLRRHEVVVKLTPSSLVIQLGEKIILSGQLYSNIKKEDSMWLLEDRVLHLTMPKRNRRGNYANQCSNADTFWRSIMKDAPQQECLNMAYPPDKYYALPIEEEGNQHLTVTDSQPLQPKRIA